jgi:hypothetical protein
MKTMGRLLESDGGSLQQPNRLQPIEKVNAPFPGFGPQCFVYHR